MVKKGRGYAIISYKHICGSFRHGKEHDENVRKKTDDMLTNMLIPLENRSLFTHGS